MLEFKNTLLTEALVVNMGSATVEMCTERLADELIRSSQGEVNIPNLTNDEITSLLGHITT